MAERARLHRRIAGMLRKRLADARFDELADPRDPRGLRWKLTTLLHTAIVGLCAGCESLAQLEELTQRLATPMRRWLGIARRVPDTTLRDLLCRLSPMQLRRHLHAALLPKQSRAAIRRKALSECALPFGVAALDGKATAVPSCDDFYAQRQTQSEGPLIGVARTVTSVLVSHPARPCLDVMPIPAATNEMGVFETALRALCRAYHGLDLFRLVTYDAGACSLANASLVRELGLHYFFALKSTQATLHREAERLLSALGIEQIAAQTEDQLRGERIVRRLYLTDAMSGFDTWSHLRTVLRVESETFDAAGRRIAHEVRYFLSSLPLARLSPEQWLLLVRLHWGVETARPIGDLGSRSVKHSLDVAFAEDDHPWIHSLPRATVAVAILRRVAYTIMTLFRSVTQRSDSKRHAPWRQLLLDVYVTLAAANADDLFGLRRHTLPPAPA